MIKKRNIAAIILLCYASVPLWGGAGRPQDGFLSFILVLAFLLLLLGILHLVACLKRKIDNLLEDIF